MPEPLAELLSRFAPDGTVLDRDALLVAAGRASARPNRIWAALTGGLAASHLLTLALLWPKPTPPVGPMATAPPTPQAVEKSALPDVRREATELWSLNRRMLQSESGGLPPSLPVDPMIPDGPPLHALAASPPAWLD